MSNLVPTSWRNTVEDLRERVAGVFDRWLSRRDWVTTAARDDLFGETFLASRVTPVVEVEETDDDVLVTAEMPGMKKEDFSVELAGNRLLLRGEKKASREQKERNYYYSETAYGAFFRAVPLPCEVDWERASAKHKHGVLTVRVPKSEAARSRRVHVQVT